MTTALTFNSVTLSPVQHQGSLWIRAAELARALGYSRENSVSRLYRNNAEEFTPDMTQVIEISESTDSVLSTKTRIFSPRGCHLIAMFARTAVAKQFRRWVLDVLDKVCQPDSAPRDLPLADAPITPDQQCTLQAIVKAKIEALPGDKRSNRALYPKAWGMFNNHFRLAQYRQLPQSRMSEAVAYLTQMALAAPALPETEPTPPSIPEDDRHFAIARELKRIVLRLEQLCPALAQANYPRFSRRSAREAARYEIQASFYRMGNASLKTAIASLTASWQVWDMMK